MTSLERTLWPTAVVALLVMLQSCSDPNQRRDAKVQLFADNASQTHIIGYGPNYSGDASIEYFRLVGLEADTDESSTWTAQITDGQVLAVFQVLVDNGIFDLFLYEIGSSAHTRQTERLRKERMTPGMLNSQWKIGIESPTGSVSRSVSKERFDSITASLSRALPQTFDMSEILLRVQKPLPKNVPAKQK